VSERPDAQQIVERVFREDLHLDVPSPEFDLVESGLLDSMALIDLVHRLEQVLGVRLDLETLDLDDWRSVRSITSLLGRMGAGEARG
jgi:acyl carrier protein